MPFDDIYFPLKSSELKESDMNTAFGMQTRRSVTLGVGLAAAGLALAMTSNASATEALAPTGHEHDWDWMVGRWTVRHHKLKARLAGSHDWVEFDGTTQLWTTLGGLGNIDDNLLHDPSGSYRAVTLRAFDAAAGRWFIWWQDGRSPADLGAPVAGGFKDGVGIFLGDDTLGGKPIKVRFVWSEITANSARWEQAFSGDAGETWETNWRMQFTRVRG